MKDKQIRLQKFLAERGVASRRRCEELIAQGHVQVNGKTVTDPGIRTDPAKDKITVDGRPMPKHRQAHRTIALYKPRGYICSAAGGQGQTVYELIKDIPERLVPVGRIDKNSEGLLLMSNDGDLVLRLTHPRFEHEKAYHVTVSGKVDSNVLKRLRSRLVIDGYRIRPAKVTLLQKMEESGRSRLEFVLKEGRKRQIRKMCELTKLKVHRLIRVRIGSLTLAGLKPGKWRNCSAFDNISSGEIS